MNEEEIYDLSFQNPSDAIVKHYLKNSKVIAVVGLSDREETTSNRVSKEMQERGYRIIPVNPRVAGRQILVRLFMPVSKTFHSQWILSMYTAAVNFCRMWRMIFCRLMPRFSGLSWAWRVRKPSRFCGQLVETILSWTAVLNASIPA